MDVAWGILSTARINEWVLAATANSLGMRFVAVASRQRERAEAFAASQGLKRAYAGYDALLADPEIQAVYISLPNALHIEWSVKALEAGKHVLCEKPVGRAPATVDAAFDIAERRGLLLREAFMYRHHPQTTRLRELVDQNVIGTLAHIRATLSFRMEQAETDVRRSLELDGGALMDVGCYCVSAVRLLAGEPASVYGERLSNGADVDLRFLGMLRCPGDVTAQFDCGMSLPRRDALEVVGTEGALLLSDPWHSRTRTIELRRGGGHDDATVEQLPVDPDKRSRLRFDILDAYRLEFEAFSAAIRGERELEFGRDDAVGQARVLQALFRSAQAGRPLALEQPRVSTFER